MITTNDIYYASYLHSIGFWYHSAEKKSNGNIIFLFNGDDKNQENEAEYAFYDGLGNVNVRNYITSLSLIGHIVYKLTQNKE